MSKYIMQIGNSYSINNNCDTCGIIDKKYREIFSQEPQDQDKIRRLEEFLINGYDLVNVYESNNKTTKEYAEYMATIKSVSDDAVNRFINSRGDTTSEFNINVANMPTMVFSRWCKDCGARKHDIIDPSRILNLTEFKFNISREDNIVTLKWSKINYILPFIVNIYRKIGTAETSKYELICTVGKERNIVKDILQQDGQAYFYKLEWVNEIGEILFDKYADLLYPVNKDHYPGQPTNIDFVMHRHLIKNISNEYVIEDYIRVDYDPPLEPQYRINDLPINLQVINDRFLINLEVYNKNDYSAYFPIQELGYGLIYDINYHDIPINFEVECATCIQEDLLITFEVGPTADRDLGDIIVKAHKEYVPPLEYDPTAYEFVDNKWLPENPAGKYFAKVYSRSKLFNKSGIGDHLNYPSLYFYDKNINPFIIPTHYYPEDLYNLQFIEGKRKMTISFSVKMYSTMKAVRIIFKQDDQYITDDYTDGYKVVEVPIIHALYDYQVNITGLASNSYWVFGAFPIYESCDPDIRLEYQTIVKIRPWFPYDKDITLYDFYDINHWYLNDDFTKYNYEDDSHIRQQYNKNLHGKVMMCEKLKHHDVGVLLVHEEEACEYTEISFDYKMLNYSTGDVYNAFINHELRMRTENTDQYWHHFQQNSYNDSWLIIRWELMKHSDYRYSCAFCDNVHIRSIAITDIATINFERKDEIQFKEYYYYNRKIKYNKRYLHVPKRFYNVDINIYKYVNQLTTDENYMDYLTYTEEHEVEGLLPGTQLPGPPKKGGK